MPGFRVGNTACMVAIGLNSTEGSSARDDRIRLALDTTQADTPMLKHSFVTSGTRDWARRGTEGTQG
eukprot:15322991-Alexandrium_andersonii.AAC.1